MRILHITPRFTEHSGGDGLYAHHLVYGQLRAGHDVFVHSITPKSFIRINFTWNAGKSEWQRQDVDVGARRSDFFSENIWSTRASRSLNETLIVVRPDVIHIHAIHQHFTASCIRVLRNAGVPIVYSVHDYKLLCGNAGFFSDRTYEPCFRCLSGETHHPISECCKKSSLSYSIATAVQMSIWKYRDFLDILSVVHAPSQYVSDLLSKNMRIKTKVVMERHPQLFASSLRQDENTPLSILYFGRMVPHKGAAIAVQAVQDLNIPVNIVGTGPELNKCKQIAGSSPYIKFHGWKTQTEIRDLMGKNTIAVLPYLAPETFCFAVLEAMMEGCCVVTSTRGAIPELVKQRETGILVDIPTATNFREALDLAISDAGLRSKISYNAARSNGDLLGIDAHVTQMVGLYQSVIT